MLGTAKIGVIVAAIAVLVVVPIVYGFMQRAVTSNHEFDSKRSDLTDIDFSETQSFRDVRSQEFVSGDKSTMLKMSSSEYQIREGGTITVDGRLTDSYGNGIAERLILLKDDDPTDPDDHLADAYTDALGEFEMTWAVEDTDFQNNIANIFAIFYGDSYYYGSRSDMIYIKISSLFQESGLVETRLGLSSNSNAAMEDDYVFLSGRLTDSSREGLPNRMIEIRKTHFLEDYLLGMVMTDSRGYFSFNWPKVNSEPVPIEIFALFAGDDDYSGSRSGELDTDVNKQSNQTTSATFSRIRFSTSAYSVYEGDNLELIGQLTDDSRNGIRGVTVFIKDEDSLDSDYELASLETATDGTFALSWQAERLDPYDDTIELYAGFPGSEEYSKSQSTKIQIQILSSQKPDVRNYSNTQITIDTSSKQVKGELIHISGCLKDENDIGIQNALVYIKDEDLGSGDDTLGKVYTRNNGWYSFYWKARSSDAQDSTVEIYSIFEGSRYYSQTRSVIMNIQVS